MDEVSGSLGDLGTFLPLILNLAAIKVILFSPALFWAGFYNVLTGFIWNSPMPVQPMKTIAAVALTLGANGSPGLTPEEVMGAGISVGTIVLVLGVTGFVDFVNWIVPLAVVRGLQLGLGFSMIKSALNLIMPLPFVSQVDCILLGVLSMLFVLFCSRVDRLKFVPTALILTIIGFVIAMVQTSHAGRSVARPDFPPVWVGSSLVWDDVWNGFLKAGLAQLPLTTLNSVVSVCDLNNKRLFKHEPEKYISRRSVATSVGLMNLSGLWFGAMPMCHGAGGLAAQYKFGARTGTAIIILGLAKMIVGVILGESASVVLEYFPKSILGAMLVFAGLSLSLAGISKMTHVGDEDVEKNQMIFLTTAAVTVVLKTGWGFCAGMIMAIFYGGFDHVVVYVREKQYRTLI